MDVGMLAADRGGQAGLGQEGNAGRRHRTSRAATSRTDVDLRSAYAMSLSLRRPRQAASNPEPRSTRLVVQATERRSRLVAVTDAFACSRQS